MENDTILLIYKYAKHKQVPPNWSELFVPSTLLDPISPKMTISLENCALAGRKFSHKGFDEKRSQSVNSPMCKT